MKSLEHQINRIDWLLSAIMCKAWRYGTFNRQCWATRRSTMNTIRVLKVLGITPALLVDAGANNGQWSYWLTKEYPDMRLLSFEPNPACHPLGTVNRCALSDEAGEVRFETEMTETLQGHINPNGSVVVSMRRFDSLGIDLVQPAILKVDCENHTAKALAGFGATINQFKAVVVELVGDDFNMADYKTEQWRQIHQFMHSNGFTKTTVVECGMWSGRPCYLDVMFWK